MSVLLNLAALLFLCAFFTCRCHVHSALTPLLSLSVLSLWFTLAGMLDVLVPAAWLCRVACFALGAWGLLGLRHRGKTSLWRALLTPGSVLFWGMTLFFLAYFALRQPLFTDFDEFSFWGTAAKMTCVNNRLYTVGEIGWAWQASQSPGLVVLGYFVQFGGAFAPWKIYLAYDMLFFACFAAVLGRLYWRQYAVAVPLAAVCWCVPWFFTTYNRTISQSGVYMSTYGDIPAGLVLGGAVAAWLWLRGRGQQIWPVVPMLVLAGNIKSNTFVLALLGAGLVAADAILFAPQKPWKKGLAGRLCFGAVGLAAPLAVYLAWNRYIAALAQQNAAAGGMGQTDQGVVSMAVSGLRILLGLPVGAYYNERMGQFIQAAADMQDAFFHSRLCMLNIGDRLLYRLGLSEQQVLMFGSGVSAVALILLVFVLAALLAGKGRLRHRTLAMAALTSLGFVAYNFMLALSYGFVFKPFQAERLEDYNRYIYTFYIGWFLIALCFLALALAGQPAPDQKAAPRRARLGGSALLLVLACAMLVRTGQLVLPQFSVLGFSDATFADQRVKQARADAVAAAVEPDSRIFLVSQGDNGLVWFEYCYDFLPLIVDYSGDLERGGGGGTFGTAELTPAIEGTAQYYYHAYTAAEFDAAVRASGCEYLFIDRLDTIFVQSYAGLFSDELQAAKSGQTLLYRVEAGGPYAPVEMEVPQ